MLYHISGAISVSKIESQFMKPVPEEQPFKFMRRNSLLREQAMKQASDHRHIHLYCGALQKVAVHAQLRPHCPLLLHQRGAHFLRSCAKYRRAQDIGFRSEV